MKRFYILLALLLIYKLGLSQTQTCNRQISIHVRAFTFDSLILNLRKKHKINVIYSSDRLTPLKKRISIDFTNVQVSELMTHICKYYNLKFECSGSHIMLINHVRQYQETVKSLPTKAMPSVTSLKNDTIPETDKIEVKTLMMDSIPDRVVYVDIQSTNTMNSMIKRQPVLPLVKKKLTHQLMVGFISIDLNRYHFTPLADENQNYSVPITFSPSLAYYWSFNNKVSVGIAATYSRKEFTYNRNFKMFEIDDPVSIPNRTKLKSRYIEVPIEIHYSLISSHRVTVQTTSGMTASILISNKETTQYLTQGEPNTKYFLNASRKYLYSLFFGVRCSIRLVHNFGIFCEPRYQKFLHKVNSRAMEAGADLFRLNTGIYIKF